MLTSSELTSLTTEQQDAAQVIQACYQELAKQQETLLTKLLSGVEVFYQHTHYPKHDVKDRKTSSQYYYHSHASFSEERPVEHGHFHLFIHHPAQFTSEKPLYRSVKHHQNPLKDNLCHLVAISMNAQGLPIALMTTNHWVTGGIWYSSAVTAALVDQFCLTHDKPFSEINRWISAIVQLFKPEIRLLLEHRDAVLQNWQEAHSESLVFTDRRLEITSFYSLEKRSNYQA